METRNGKEALNKRIALCEKYKSYVIDSVEKLKTSYENKEITYNEYNKKLKDFLKGRTPGQWIKYYNDYIKYCEKKIKEQEKKITKRNLLTIFLLIFFVLLLIAFFYFSSSFTGFAVKEKTNTYTEIINVEFSESSQYEWTPENPGQLGNIKISGEIIGEGNAKVYLEDSLILDTEKLEAIPLKAGYLILALLFLLILYLILRRKKLKKILHLSHPKKHKKILLFAINFLVISIIIILLVFSIFSLYNKNVTMTTYTSKQDFSLNITVEEPTNSDLGKEVSQETEKKLPSETDEITTDSSSILGINKETLQEIPLKAGYIVIILLILLILYIILRKRVKKKKRLIFIFLILTLLITSFIFYPKILDNPSADKQGRITGAITGFAVNNTTESQDETAETLETEEPASEETPPEETNETESTKEENVTETSPEVSEQSQGNVTETKEPKIKKKKFNDICEETCDLKNLNLNKSSYTLRIEVTNATLKLDKIKYEIITFEEIEEENITEKLPEEIPENITKIPKEKIPVSPKQYKAVINRPVKWVKVVNAVETKEVEIPKQATNITVKTGEEVQQALEDIEKYEQEIESTDKKDLLEKTITGGAIQESKLQEEITETSESKIIDIGSIATQTQETEIAVEYFTEGPTAIEEETSRGKKVIVSGPEELNITDILAFAEIPEKFSVGQESRIKIYWQEENQYMNFDSYDLDNNGKLDYVEWLVPHLSNQTFEIILITKAEHLDSNRQFISDIYNETKELDGIWSERIYTGEYVRVTFEQNLTSSEDISIYLNVKTGNPSIEVYEINGTELIAEFTSLNSNQYNTVFLTNLQGSQDVFDLKISGGSIEIEHIIDPVTTYNYFLRGEGGSGTGVTDTLETTQGGTETTWQSGGNGNYITFIKQYTEETTITTEVISTDIWCAKAAAAGGDQVKLDLNVYDCGTSSDCSSTDAEICATAGAFNCDSLTVIYVEGSCTPISNTTIETNNYLGVRYTAAENKAGAENVLYFNSTSKPSSVNITEGTSAGDSTNPTVSFGTNPVDASNKTSNSVTFDFKASDNIDIDTIQLWGNWTGTWHANYTNTSYTNNTWLNITVNNIPDGKGHIWAIFANDSAGNSDWTNTNRTFTVDASGPIMNNEGSNETEINQNEWFCLNITATDSVSEVDIVYAEVWNTTNWLNYTMSDAGTTSCDGESGDDVYGVEIQGTATELWNYSKSHANDTLNNWNTYDFSDLTINVTSAANNPPTISWVESISAQNPSEDSTKTITFNFTATDQEGYTDINVSTAKARFQLAGETTRLNNSCVNWSQSGNDVNFTCTINMWYFDKADTGWTINVTVQDNSQAGAENSSTIFTYNLLTAMTMSPNSLNWGTINLPDTNIGSTDDPIVINNTGNDENLNINITSYDLQGETNTNYYIYAANFTVENIAEGCSGTAMSNATSINITSAILQRGNNSLNYNNETSGQEELFFCLKGVPQNNPSQSYSSSAFGTWTIRILLVAVIPAGKKKKKKSKKKKKEKQKEKIKLVKDDKLMGVLDLIVDKLKEEYPSNKKDIIKTIIEKLNTKYEINRKEFLEIIKAREGLKIPVTIFSKRIGALESITKYMRENLKMNYHEIAKELGRDQRTIWTAYKKAIEKQKLSIKIKDTKIFLPISIFENKNLTILESLVVYLKQKGLKYIEIAKLLDRDQRNIWTIYSRAIKK